MSKFAPVGMALLSDPQVFERLCERTRARTWDPLIKRHAASVDFSIEFFQLSQNSVITDQWLTAKNPTVCRPAVHVKRITGIQFKLRFASCERSTLGLAKLRRSTLLRLGLHC